MHGSVTKWAISSLDSISLLRTLSSADDFLLLFLCQYLQECHFLLLWSLFLYRKSVFALSLLKMIVFINFIERETLSSFNKLCKDAYGCLFSIRGTCLSTCMTLELSSPSIWVLCVPWSVASMFCPHCADGSKILFLVDRVTYLLGSELQRDPYWQEICTQWNFLCNM